MTNELLTLLWHSTVGSSVAILAVLLARRPLRRVFGCGAVYCAWLAVPLCAAAGMAPPPIDPAWTLRVVSVGFAAVRVAQMPTDVPVPLWPSVSLIVWSLGFIVSLAWQVRVQRKFVQALGPLVVTGDVAVSNFLVAGPSLVGLWRPVIAVPADFDQRYTLQERELILAHERAHARHGDVFVNAGCAALRCIWWFNPLVHVAARVVRVDQELTRDAEVIRAHPKSRHAYASALLKAQLVAVDAPITCHWQSRHPLKERIMILTLTTPTVLRRLGMFVVSLAMLGGTYAAWAARAAPDIDSGRIEHARWTNARPSTVVRVEAGPEPKQFLVSAVITDLATGSVLAKPRLLAFAGTPATFEIGSEEVSIRLVVTVNSSGRFADYTSEVLRNGKVDSSWSGTLTLAANDHAPPLAQEEAPVTTAGPDAGLHDFNLSFSSSDARELACAADVFAARGEVGSAEEMRRPADGKIHVASFATTTPTINKSVDELVAALSKCQLGLNSNLAWSNRPANLSQP